MSILEGQTPFQHIRQLLQRPYKQLSGVQSIKQSQRTIGQAQLEVVVTYLSAVLVQLRVDGFHNLQ